MKTDQRSSDSGGAPINTTSGAGLRGLRHDRDPEDLLERRPRVRLVRVEAPDRALEVVRHDLGLLAGVPVAELHLCELRAVADNGEAEEN